MKKEQVISIIKEAAERHGFVTNKYQWTDLIEIEEPEYTHFLNIMVRENIAPEIDWSKQGVTMELHFQASLASMGGNLTPERLIKASEIIRAGAELVRELESMGLKYTEG